MIRKTELIFQTQNHVTEKTFLRIQIHFGQK